MDYKANAKDIVALLTYDYAGYKEKTFPDAQVQFLEDAARCETDKAFSECVYKHVARYNDPHLMFIDKHQYIEKVPFNVRRYKDRLYVTEIYGPTSLSIGDVIVKIDDLTITQVAHQNIGLDRVIERQRFRDILSRHTYVTLDNGKTYKLDKTVGNVKREGSYTWDMVAPDTVCFKITDFMSAQGIIDMLQSYRISEYEARNWVIDVRHNYGGSDSAYFPLVPYIFGHDVSVSWLFHNDLGMYFNVTKRNRVLRMAAFEEVMDALDEAGRTAVKEMTAFFDKSDGMYLYDVDDDAEEMILTQPFPLCLPERVVILTDMNTSSSGESFVSVMRKSFNVKVIGRHTKGCLDYSNVAFQDYGSFEIGYPTSKLAAVAEGLSQNILGEPVDIHIPWSPDMLKQDIDMARALALLSRA